MNCPCGNFLKIKESQIGRKKYCSKKCFYLFRKRPSNLVYKIVAVNRAWINKGQRLSPNTEFKKGDGEFHGSTYDGLHDWVERVLGKPDKCEFCGGNKHLEWSNKSGEYKLLKNDWQRLCKKCHCRYDFEKFGARKEFYK